VGIIEMAAALIAIGIRLDRLALSDGIGAFVMYVMGAAILFLAGGLFGDLVGSIRFPESEADQPVLVTRVVKGVTGSEGQPNRTLILLIQALGPSFLGLMGTIEAIATATDEDPEDLLEVATNSARRSIIGKEQAAEQVERDLERMSRERLLPDEKTLEKVARYEAHLSRGLYKALHELEALQTRRSGSIAPLARLDIEGIGE
jgi:hypothetical protein